MAQTTEKIWAVVPAAGVGRRMGYSTPKQYLPLAGKTMAEVTLERLLGFAAFEQLVVAVAKDDPSWAGLEISNHPKVRTCIGGDERVNSVLSALNYLEPLAAQDDWVMVHDIARPCIRLTDIDLLLNSARANNVGGLLALPVTDTVKRGTLVDSEEGLPVVISTEPRQQIWRALTPQLFRYKVLKDSLQKALVAEIDITDESSPDNIESWDSLKHMNLIIALEEEFEVTFTDNEIFKMMNYASIKSIIIEK